MHHHHPESRPDRLDLDQLKPAGTDAELELFIAEDSEAILAEIDSTLEHRDTDSGKEASHV